MAGALEYMMETEFFLFRLVCVLLGPRVEENGSFSSTILYFFTILLYTSYRLVKSLSNFLKLIVGFRAINALANA